MSTKIKTRIIDSPQEVPLKNLFSGDWFTLIHEGETRIAIKANLHRITTPVNKEPVTNLKGEIFYLDKDTKVRKINSIALELSY